jgi:hypothetical protein
VDNKNKFKKYIYYFNLFLNKKYFLKNLQTSFKSISLTLTLKMTLLPGVSSEWLLNVEILQVK